MKLFIVRITNKIANGFRRDMFSRTFLKDASIPSLRGVLVYRDVT